MILPQLATNLDCSLQENVDSPRLVRITIVTWCGEGPIWRNAMKEAEKTLIMSNQLKHERPEPGTEANRLWNHSYALYVIIIDGIIYI